MLKVLRMTSIVPRATYRARVACSLTAEQLYSVLGLSTAGAYG